MKKRLFLSVLMIWMITSLFSTSVNAYSYGDPGEEQLAEAYKELENYVETNEWDQAMKVYESYQKDFDLYFQKPQKDLEVGFKNKDKDVVLKSYQAAMRLNIERRLHFAQEQFDDYGQAKLLLAKARGTFTVLEPLMLEKSNQETIDKIYQAFDASLTSLGNPGLFGIGSKNNDQESFDKNVNYIVTELQPLFPIVSEIEKDKSHLTEENLGLMNGLDEESNSSFWLWFTVGLFIVFILIILAKRLSNRQQK